MTRLEFEPVINPCDNLETKTTEDYYYTPKTTNETTEEVTFYGSVDFGPTWQEQLIQILKEIRDELKKLNEH